MIKRWLSLLIVSWGLLGIVSEGAEMKPATVEPKEYIFVDSSLIPYYYSISEGVVTEEMTLSLFLMYDRLPDKIKTTFFENGWSLVLTDKSIEDTYWDGKDLGKIAGLTVYRQKKIYISASDWSIQCVAFHEFGHYLDYISGMVSRTPEFVACYEKEKDTEALRDYARMSAIEFLAESFELYMLDENLAREEIPNTVVFIEKMLEI